LAIQERGPEDEDRAPDPDGGIAAPLEAYRANGHRRLDPKTCEEEWTRCHKSGPPRRVPGRKPGMVWIDDDVEREERDE
jgi:hypothetical protein